MHVTRCGHAWLPLRSLAKEHTNDGLHVMPEVQQTLEHSEHVDT